MAMAKHNIGVNEDGTARYLFATEKHAVVTGPILGTVTLGDGTKVDVSEAVVEAETPEQAAEIAHLIGLRYHNEGHPTDPGFVYADAAATSVPDPVAVSAAVAATYPTDPEV